MDFLPAGTILGDKIENRKNVEGEQMNNPWEDIKLDDYENHMSLDSVKQLQTMDAIMKEQLVIANLLIEYIGYQAFRDAILRAKPEYVSCVIQINKDDHNWVSDSTYLHAFDRLDEVHFQMEEQELKKTMEEIGYQVLSENDCCNCSRNLSAIGVKV